MPSDLQIVEALVYHNIVSNECNAAWERIKNIYIEVVKTNNQQPNVDNSEYEAALQSVLRDDTFTEIQVSDIVRRVEQRLH